MWIYTQISTAYTELSTYCAKLVHNSHGYCG